MTPRIPGALVVLLLLVLGGVFGWLSHRAALSAKQEAWKAEVDSAHVATVAALARSALLRDSADAWREHADSAEARARRAEAGRRIAARATAEAEASLAAAATRADSGEAALALVPALRTERDAAIEEAHDWQVAADAAKREAAVLRVRGDSLASRVVDLDARLEAGKKIIGSSGCRIPLVGLRCPTFGPSYSIIAALDDGTVTIRHGPGVSATWSF